MKETVSAKIRKLCSLFTNREVEKASEQLKENNKMTKEKFEKLIELKNKIERYEKALRNLKAESSDVSVTTYEYGIQGFMISIKELGAKEALIDFMNKQLKQLKDEFERG